MKKVNKELLKGSLELIILAVLKDEAQYGYEIAKQIKQNSKEVFDLGEGTLYPLLHKLEKEKLLQAYWQEVGGRRRKYYGITKQGKKTLLEKKEEWQIFSSAVKAIVVS